MISRLRHQEVRRDRTGHHESAHDLQHSTKMIDVLLFRVLGLECVREEDLDEPGAEFAGGRSDAMAGAAVARGEDFGWDLGFVNYEPATGRGLR
jgi:hypothetical protein